MITALALTMQLLLAAEGNCYFVGNTRILVLPTCDIGPATIAELTEDPAPATRASLQRPTATLSGRRRIGGVPQPAPRTVMLRGNEELERRLELAQQERIDAVTRRLAAEQQRDVALGQLAEARRALAAAEARLAGAGPCGGVTARPRRRAAAPRSGGGWRGAGCRARGRPAAPAR